MSTYDLVSGDENNKNSKQMNLRILSKSKRSYSISIQSSKQFELSLRKPRNKMKHFFTRCRAWMYSLFLLLFKHHGRPPSNFLYGFFFYYSLFLAMDILLLVVFLLHLWFPISNLETVGIPFLLCYPLLPILSPLVAIQAAIWGQP